MYKTEINENLLQEREIYSIFCGDLNEKKIQNRIYVSVCVCVCVYIYIYIYIYKTFTSLHSRKEHNIV